MTAHAWILALVILSFVESNFSCPPEKSLAYWAGRVRHQSQSTDIFSMQTVPSGFSLRQQIPVSVHRIQLNTHAWLASETKQRWKTNDGWSTLIQVYYRNIKWQTVSLEHEILLIQKWQNFHAQPSDLQIWSQETEIFLQEYFNLLSARILNLSSMIQLNQKYMKLHA